jgi:hypothetical protein
MELDIRSAPASRGIIIAGIADFLRNIHIHIISHWELMHRYWLAFFI